MAFASHEMGSVKQSNTISVGGNHAAAIDENGSLWMWGQNSVGEVGNGATTGVRTPVDIMDDVVSVSLGYRFSAAIKSDGSLWTWGSNGYGQLGDGTTEDSSVPIKVMDNVVAVSCGNSNVAAIKADGSLWMWGNNSMYTLGNNGVGNTTVPYGRYYKLTVQTTPIKIMDDVVAVSVAHNSVGAIKNDGSLWVWGWNPNGQLGNFGKEVVTYGGEKDIIQPIPIKLTENVSTVSMGTFHTAIVKTDGSLWMCGRNTSGEFGNGTTDSASTLTKVMENVVSVSLGDENTAIIKSDGSLWTCGRNLSGELGTGTTTKAIVPVKVMDNVVAVNFAGASLSDTAVALKSDGTMWLCGSNSYLSAKRTYTQVMSNIKVPDTSTFNNVIIVISQHAPRYSTGMWD